MKPASNSLSQGIVRGTISFYTYCDAAYSALNNFLHKQNRLFSTPHLQPPPVKKQHHHANKHVSKTAAPRSSSGVHRSTAGVTHRRSA